MTETRPTEARLAHILGTCFLLSAALILLWFLLFLVAGDLAYAIHSKLFDIDRSQFEAMNYFGMTFIKILAFTLFLIPYIALKITGSRRGKST